MDYLTSLLDFEGKKSFKKDIHSEEVHVEVYFERSIKWLGLFSLALAVIAQVMNEVSGTDMKCFPDKRAGFDEKGDWMKDQMDLSKAFGEYVDVHCATAMVDYGPIEPNATAGSAAKYSRADIDAIAKGTLHLPKRRCIRKYKDAAYCTCLAKNEGKTKTELAKSCPLPKPPKGKGKVPNDYELMEQSKIKYKEEMFHHYFAWYLLMQAIGVLLPMHLWNAAFSEKILRKFLKIHECTQTPTEEMKRAGTELIRTLRSIGQPYMTLVFVVKQLYFVVAFLWGWNILNEYVGYGIQENQVTRCLMQEYAFVICASPANGSIWFVYVIDFVVIWLIIVGGAVNLVLLLVNWLRGTHLKKDFLKKLLDKLFENNPSVKDQLTALQNDRFSDYTFFSRLCQENNHIFGDIYITLIVRNEIAVSVNQDDLEELEDEIESQYVNAARQTVLNRRMTQKTEPREE